MKKITLLLGLLFVSTSSHADEVRSNISIQKINTISIERSSSPSTQGLTILTLPSGAWGSSSCRPTAAVIIPNDEHVYSAALAAFMADKNVEIKVDSTIVPYSNICKVNVLEILK